MEETMLLDPGIVLLESGEPCAAVELGTPATLLITIVLTGAGGEET